MAGDSPSSPDVVRAFGWATPLSFKVCQVEWLGNEIERTDFQCLDGGFHAAVSRDNGHWRSRDLLLHPLDELEAVSIRQTHVGQTEVVGLLRE